MEHRRGEGLWSVCEHERTRVRVIWFRAGEQAAHRASDPGVHLRLEHRTGVSDFLFRILVIFSQPDVSLTALTVDLPLTVDREK
jgi:hypothetical protein